jgi:hypothetical protein
MTSVIERASRYLQTMEPSIQGQQGSIAGYKAAIVIIQGFGLDEETALGLFIAEFNPRCVPPWSVSEARHKIQDAAKASTGKPVGYLLGKRKTDNGDATRRSDSPPTVVSRASKKQRAVIGARALTLAECKALANQRNLHGYGIRLFSRLGTIQTGLFHGQRVWGVGDAGGDLSAIRDIDGELIFGIKTQCLVSGANFHRPYGFTPGLQVKSIAIAEGLTDLLALCDQIVWESDLSCIDGDPFNIDLDVARQSLTCLPLCMLSATSRIDGESVSSFKGKKVRLFVDNDGAAMKSAVQIGQTLKDVAASVDMFDCGDYVDKPGADFNDCFNVVSERILP